MSTPASNLQFAYLNLSGQVVADKLHTNFVEVTLTAKQSEHLAGLVQKVMTIPCLKPGQRHGEEAVAAVGGLTVMLSEVLPYLNAVAVVLPEDMRQDTIEGIHFFMNELCPDVALFVWNNGELRTLTPEDEVNSLDEIEEMEDRKVH